MRQTGPTGQCLETLSRNQTFILPIIFIQRINDAYCGTVIFVLHKHIIPGFYTVIWLCITIKCAQCPQSLRGWAQGGSLMAVSDLSLFSLGEYSNGSYGIGFIQKGNPFKTYHLRFGLRTVIVCNSFYVRYD